MDSLYALVLKGVHDDDLIKYTRALTEQVVEYMLITVENLEKEGIQPSSRRIKERLSLNEIK